MAIHSSTFRLEIIGDVFNPPHCPPEATRAADRARIQALIKEAEARPGFLFINDVTVPVDIGGERFGEFLVFVAAFQV